jgi:hypothetical protein
MKFARVVFSVAAVYGLIVLLPQYFLIEKNSRDFPPAITHAEYYYGFIGVAIAWQIAFLVFAKNPVRYRPLMLPAIIEKGSFGIPAGILYMLGRLSVSLFAAGIIDLVLGLLFVVAYCPTPSRDREARNAQFDEARRRCQPAWRRLRANPMHKASGAISGCWQTSLTDKGA